MNKLKKCPCGQYPKQLLIEDGYCYKYSYATGYCCLSWSVEFINNNSNDYSNLMELAINAWNNSPRG